MTSGSRVVRTVEVFTPTRAPVLTIVKREEIWTRLGQFIEQGGVFVSILATTKLGKSTLIRDALRQSVFESYIPGQDLAQDGVPAMWDRIASHLGIPSSKQKGKVSGDKSKWAFMGRVTAGFAGVGASASSTAAGEHHVDHSTSETHDIDTTKAVADSLKELAKLARDSGQNPPIIAIDDFHFIVDEEKRRSLILALRPIADADATIVLASLPGRGDDRAYSNTQVAGRQEVLSLPIWNEDELEAIATAGFQALKVSAPEAVKKKIAQESHGSPQIMQQLCLNLCRANGVADDSNTVVELQPPQNWKEFFRTVKDSQSVKWLNTLRGGKRARNPRNVFEDDDGTKYDGYQLILLALHKLGSPAEVKFSALRSEIAQIVKTRASNLTEFALEQKLKSMNELALRDMTEALNRHAEAADPALGEELFTAEELGLAELIPQPVFEVEGSGNEMTIRILDPLLAYTLKWHPETIRN